MLTMVQKKIDDLKFLLEYAKWLYCQYRNPRDIGTVFTKRKGWYILHYEVVGHVPGKFPKEMHEIVKRELI